MVHDTVKSCEKYQNQLAGLNAKIADLDRFIGQKDELLIRGD
jgi:hypothetical protein